MDIPSAQISPPSGSASKPSELASKAVRTLCTEAGAWDLSALRCFARYEKWRIRNALSFGIAGAVRRLFAVLQDFSVVKNPRDGSQPTKAFSFDSLWHRIETPGAFEVHHLAFGSLCSESGILDFRPFLFTSFVQP